MRNAKQIFLIAAAVLLYGICMPAPAASAAAAYFTALPVQQAENGVLITESGEEWYKVLEFADGADYLLTVTDDTGTQRMLTATNGEKYRYVWHYERYTMTASTAPHVAALTSGGYSLADNGGRLMPYFIGSGSGDRMWSHADTALSFLGSDGVRYLKYDAQAAEPFSMTANRAEAAEVTLYSRGETLARCITRQPEAESFVTEGSGYPAPVFSVGLSDVTPDSIRWFADGAEQPCTAQEFSADILRDLPAGVHRVYCMVEAHDSSGVHYRERSADAAFLIAKGVVPDSILTFSDIHEEYTRITDAIGTVMEQTGGYLPALAVCTGDFVNGPTADKDTELSRYFPQMRAALGGLDAVYVAGNHDSAEAASVMSLSAGLGAEALSADGGLIFRGESAAAAEHGKSSRAAKGILVYGIHFDAALDRTDGGYYYSYAPIIGRVERFLQDAAGQYHGELIVIAAHSGLHTIGVQPESMSMYETQLTPWLGENAYNIDCSDALAETIDRYAEQYQMNILYLFGHDHSRSETELFLTDGDTLISTQHYADRSTAAMPLHFTYAHAGYLSAVIGCADRRFAFISRGDGAFRFDLLRAGEGLVRHTEFAEKQPYQAPAPAETTVTAAASETASVPTTANSAAPAADTGDTPYAAWIAVPASIVLLLTGKRRKIV